jgi:hypothetical protein
MDVLNRIGSWASAIAMPAPPDSKSPSRQRGGDAGNRPGRCWAIGPTPPSIMDRVTPRLPPGASGDSRSVRRLVVDGPRLGPRPVGEKAIAVLNRIGSWASGKPMPAPPDSKSPSRQRGGDADNRPGRRWAIGPTTPSIMDRVTPRLPPGASGDCCSARWLVVDGPHLGPRPVGEEAIAVLNRIGSWASGKTMPAPPDSKSPSRQRGGDADNRPGRCWAIGPTPPSIMDRVTPRLPPGASGDSRSVRTMVVDGPRLGPRPVGEEAIAVLTNNTKRGAAHAAPWGMGAPDALVAAEEVPA